MQQESPAFVGLPYLVMLLFTLPPADCSSTMSLLFQLWLRKFNKAKPMINAKHIIRSTNTYITYKIIENSIYSGGKHNLGNRFL